MMKRLNSFLTALLFSVVAFAQSDLQTYDGVYNIKSLGWKDGHATYTYRPAPDGTRIFEGKFRFEDYKGQTAEGNFKNNLQVGEWRFFDDTDTEYIINFDEFGNPSGKVSVKSHDYSYGFDLCRKENGHYTIGGKVYYFADKSYVPSGYECEMLMGGMEGKYRHSFDCGGNYERMIVAVGQNIPKYDSFYYDTEDYDVKTVEFKKGDYIEGLMSSGKPVGEWAFHIDNETYLVSPIVGYRDYHWLCSGPLFDETTGDKIEKVFEWSPVKPRVNDFWLLSAIDKFLIRKK